MSIKLGWLTGRAWDGAVGGGEAGGGGGGPRPRAGAAHQAGTMPSLTAAHTHIITVAYTLKNMQSDATNCLAFLRDALSVRHSGLEQKA